MKTYRIKTIAFGYSIFLAFTVIFGGSIALYYQNQAQLERNYNEYGRLALETVAANNYELFVKEDFFTLRKNLDRFFYRIAPIQIRAVGQSGNDLYTRTNENFKDINAEPKSHTIKVPVIAPGSQTQVGQLEIKLAISSSGLFTANPGVTIWFLIYLILAILLSVWILVRLLVSPILTLSENIRHLEPEKDSPKDNKIRTQSIVREVFSISNAVNDLLDRIKRYQIERDGAQRGILMAKLASQVSHDIRSPLASLLSVLQSAKGLDETSRIQIRTAANRIKDIANNLLEKNRKQKAASGSAQPASTTINEPAFQTEPRSVELLSALIESAVSQKRLQLQDRKEVEIESNVEANAFGAFAEIQPTELHRFVSNLINNSVEAFESGGSVRITLTATANRAILSIQDNGKGIASELLSKVVERGGTFGKKEGNGLGLSHAKETVESWGGAFKIASNLGTGTKVTLEIPLAETPTWFAETITLISPATVIVLDDDPGIHTLWDQRFQTVTPPPSILHFHSPKEILEWYRKTYGAVDNPIFLCDYEMIGSNQTGLDVIDMLGIASASILVTSRADEAEIRERCEKMRVKLLPKLFTPDVPISTETPPSATTP